MSASSSSISSPQQSSIPVFEGENYDFWCVKMKTLFISQNVWDLVNNGYEEPDSIDELSNTQKEQLKETEQRDARALLFIQQGVADNIFPRIMSASKSKEAWDTLKEEFQGDSKARAVKLLTLRRELENMKMRENETLKEFSSRFSELVNQMKAYGEEISQKRLVEKILISLPQKFDAKIAVIEETKDLSVMTVQELWGSLKSFEQRLMRHSEIQLRAHFKVN